VSAFERCVALAHKPAGVRLKAATRRGTIVVFAVLEARVTGWATRGQNTPLSGGG
jgi:hypothetical protein